MLRQISIKVKSGKHFGFLNFNKPNSKCLSNAPATQENVQEQTKSLREKKVTKKRAQIEPFAKNFFCGKVNTDILAFPEILNKEELQKLSQYTESIDNAINVLTEKDESNFDSEKVVQFLKSVDAFSLNIPFHYGGQEMTVTEICRVNETFCKNFNLGINVLNTLGTGVEELIQFGNSKQKDKYIPKISKGDCIPVTCYYEEGQNSLSQVKTEAKLNTDKDAWILNGEKIVFKTVRDSDILLVLALTEIQDFTGTLVNATSIFMLDSNTPGIIKTKVNDNCNILTFKNTHIPVENMLGSQEKGLEIYLKSMIPSRLLTGVACSSLIKDLLSELSTKLIKCDTLSKSERIQEKIAEMACTTYAIESMIYLTTGLIDGYENSDCTMESAMIKVYSTEKCLEVLLSSLHIFGADKYIISPLLQNKINTLVNWQLIEEHNDYLKLLIGMLGLQQAGLAAADTVKKIRNPFMYPGYLFKRYIKLRYFEADKPKLILRLGDYVHPSLNEAADTVEYCILKLHYLSEMILIRNGIDTLNKQMEINKLSIAAIEIFAMFATISRASRSYCIGHQNSHHEIILAEAVCKQGKRKVKDLFNDIEIGPHNSCDYSYLKFAKQILNSSGEFVEHSLKTNY